MKRPWHATSVAAALGIALVKGELHGVRAQFPAMRAQRGFRGFSACNDRRRNVFDDGVRDVPALERDAANFSVPVPQRLNAPAKHGALGAERHAHSFFE
jgi:hypothetical protein